MTATQSETTLGQDTAERFDVFLSYNRREVALVDPLADVLRERGLRVFKDDWYLRPGHYWPSALETNLAQCDAIVVAVGRNGLGPWQQREAVAALDRQDRAGRAGDPVPPVIPLLLDEMAEQKAGLVFLLQNTWVEAWDPRAPHLIVGALQGKAPAELYDQDRPDPRALICPYRGLDTFDENDAAFYFGREPDLEDLCEAVGRHPLVAIVGASGSGKSSLARAGLIPHLRRPADDRVWQVAAMKPGHDPFLALARTLLPLREPARYLEWSKREVDIECDDLKARLERDGADHLSHVLAQILEEEPGTTNLLLLVDQWEELYTYRPPDADAREQHARRVRRFIGMLLDATGRGVLRVVLTLRADYWSEVLSDEPLAARLPDPAVVHLRALDRAALEAVVRRPAERIGLNVPRDLAEVLRNDALGQPGDLPLLEFALQRLWSRRTGGALTLDAYQQMGGLREAIVSHAEAVYATLGTAERDAVPGVFAALVQVGEERTDLRRRARLSELGEAGQAVARRLAKERLLVASRDWGSGDDLVEVAHEALLRHWPRLEAWIGKRRGALITIRQLQADARGWVEKGRDAGYLWSHERVCEAANALRQLGREVRLDEDEQAFLGPINPAQMLADLKRPETSHGDRALIGERLDKLGDPRPGVGVDDGGTPVIEWRAVPGGEVAIQVERRVLGGTKPQGKLIDSFHISRFPVTVAQYRAFLKAKDGWRDDGWWAPHLYRDPQGKNFDRGRFGNEPAVYVSWFDAMAFCRWFSHRLGFDVSLPDEWQWQQAATRGDPAKIYPWGGDWDPEQEPFRANTFESFLGKATAVGMYPAGVSSTDVLDMAGTVFEWCRNKYDKPDVTGSRTDDFDTRVVRGGSWNANRDRARCANRYRNEPFNRINLVGFRVVCLSPITSSGL